MPPHPTWQLRRAEIINALITGAIRRPAGGHAASGHGQNFPQQAWGGLSPHPEGQREAASRNISRGHKHVFQDCSRHSLCPPAPSFPFDGTMKGRRTRSGGQHRPPAARGQELAAGLRVKAGGCRAPALPSEKPRPALAHWHGRSWPGPSLSSLCQGLSLFTGGKLTLFNRFRHLEGDKCRATSLRSDGFPAPGAEGRREGRAPAPAPSARCSRELLGLTAQKASADGNRSPRTRLSVSERAT